MSGERRERILKFLLILHFFSSKSPFLLVFPVEEKKRTCFQQVKLQPDSLSSSDKVRKGRKEGGKGPRASKTDGRDRQEQRRKEGDGVKKRERIMTVISPYYAATSFLLLFHSPTPLGCDAPSRGGQAEIHPCIKL